jgi:hypothetical protein
MRNAVILFIMMTIVFGFYHQGKGNEKAVGTEIEMIAEVMNERNIEIKEWSIYVRQQYTAVESYTEFNQFVNGVMKKAGQFEWNFSQNDKEHWNASGTLSSDNYTQKINLFAYPHKGKYETYIIYSVKGSNFNEWQQISSNVTSTIHDVFLDNPTIFSCVKGQTSDTIESVLYAEASNILNELSATTIEELSEETFVSLSAYTEKWKHTVPTENGKINLQVALRETGMGGATSVVIGTPIITAEY